MNNMNFYEEIQKIIREKAETQSSEKEFSMINMFKHLIELMGEKEFNLVFDSYFMHEEEFDTSFYDFHKSMRQTDFYLDYYQRIPMKTTSGKDSHIQKNIGSHLDMLFWNLIHVTNVPYKILKELWTIATAKTKES